MIKHFYTSTLIALLMNSIIYTKAISSENHINKLNDIEVGSYLEKATLGYVNTDLEYSRVIFDRQNDVTNKALKQLQFRQSGNVPNRAVTVGGRFQWNYMYETTNVDGKFPIISRLPNQHTSGDTGYESVINDASFNFTVTPASWLTVFGQWEYTEVEYPGQKTFQARKHWVTLGDLDKFPLYLTYGRRTLSFGNFASYAPFTHNHSSHYFWAQSEDPHFELGAYHQGWHVTASFIPNQRGNRVINTTDDEWGNYAVNFNKTHQFSNNVETEFGAGYLRGTIYDSTLAHHPPDNGAGDNEINSAWNVNGRISYKNFDLMGEYTKTTDDWPATAWQVSAFTIQSRYRDQLFDKDIIYSLMYSKGEQGEDSTEWERMDQTVAGIEYTILPNLDLGVEYLYNKGFVPLIMPTVTGDRDVKSHTINAGVKFTF